jgi:hypothetical protein
MSLMPQHTHPLGVSFPRTKEVFDQKDGIIAKREGMGGVCERALHTHLFSKH